MSRTVYVVHAIDTEGPLYESVDATFARLKSIFGIDLEPSRKTLRQLQAGEIDLDGLESAVQRVVASHLLNYNDTWDKVDGMLRDALGEKFRTRIPDSRGRGWVFNWFCVDHIDYDVNPRRRDIGYHNIFDHYRSILKETDSAEDGIHFHYHPHPHNRNAHHCATHWWAASDSLYQILTRRVIDRLWFPAANRPGFHVLRPDSHWFLEQYIPFDFSNQAMEASALDKSQSGLSDGRFGDWRRAPSTWEPYHPAHDDYQVQGSCRRWIARCLNIGTRYLLLTEREVRQAFEEAREGKPVVLAFTNHDFRDIRPDVEETRALIARVASDYPEVSFAYSEAVEAMQSALQLPAQRPCELDLELEAINDSAHVIKVASTTPTFGPQPWLAIKTVDGSYYHDNFDIDLPFHRWQYVLDEQTFPLRAVEAIGVAANNSSGTTTVTLLNARTGKVVKEHWNGERSHRDQLTPDAAATA